MEPALIALELDARVETVSGNDGSARLMRPERALRRVVWWDSEKKEERTK
jgi:hypothetical protein